MQKASEMQKTQMFYTCAKGCDAGTPFMFNFTHPFYPFFGHPNGVGGTFQSVGKGHTVCIIKQVKAFKLDKTYKAMKPMDPKRNKGLADFLRACASYAWVEFGPKGIGNDHMTHVQSSGGVTGFGSLIGQNNAPRFSRPSGGSNQDINADMSAMAAVQKRRRRLLSVEELEKNLSKQKKKRKNRQKGVAGSIPSEGTTTTAMGMPNVGRDTIGHAMYAPKTSTSNVELPPPEVTTSPLDAVKVVDDPKPFIETKDNKYGFGGAPMIGLGPQGGGSAMSGISLLEQTDGPPFTPDEGGGNPQPSPIDLPKRKKKEIDDENLVLLSTLTK